MHNHLIDLVFFFSMDRQALRSFCDMYTTAYHVVLSAQIILHVKARQLRVYKSNGCSELTTEFDLSPLPSKHKTVTGFQKIYIPFIAADLIDQMHKLERDRNC